MNDAVPKRRWFRFAFSMKALFAAITGAGIALGWIVYQLEWIRQRHAAREDGGIRIPIRCMQPSPPDAPYNKAPWSLRLFGEEPAGIDQFWLPYTTSEDEIDRIQKLFPETNVLRATGPFYGPWDAFAEPVLDAQSQPAP